MWQRPKFRYQPFWLGCVPIESPRNTGPIQRLVSGPLLTLPILWATEGFLGDYSQLEPREGWPDQEVYFNPNAQWSQFSPWA